MTVRHPVAALTLAVLLTGCSDALFVPPLSFTTVSAGGEHTCGIVQDGTVYCWGRGTEGQIGNGKLEHRYAPEEVHSAFEYVDVATGYYHSCGLRADGRISCWGWNEYGQLGTGFTVGLDVPRTVAGDRRYRAVAAGRYHTCALADSDLYCWGNNTYGQLGDGSTDHTAAPTRVAGDLRFESIAPGAEHTCALTEEGVAYCWGSNHRGQLGTGGTSASLTPAPVDTDLRFRAIAVGPTHTCAAARDGRAYCWGSNAHGELGDGHHVNMPGVPGATRPKAVQSVTQFASLTAGPSYTCGLNVQDEVRCWGLGRYGQLGDRVREGLVTPRPVFTVDDTRFTTLVAGAKHVCGVARRNTAYCWGTGVYGQLGNAATTFSPVPVRVEPSSADR